MRKENLKKYQWLKKEAAWYEEKIQALQITMMQPPIPKMSGMPGAPMHTVSSPQENNFNKLEYYKEKLHILQQNMQAIEAAIDSVKDSNRRVVLRLRYIDGLSWDLVAEKMGYSLSWVKDVHAEALGEFQ